MAGLSVLLLVAVGALTWTLVDDEPYVARNPGGSETGPGESRSEAAKPAIQPGVAAQTLERLERAIRRGERTAAADLSAGDGADAVAAQLLSGLVGNAEAARITDVTLRYVDETGAVRPDGSWPAAVAVTWRYAGFDESAARTEVTVSFAGGTDGSDGSGGSVGIAGIGGGDGSDTRTPVWMTGPLQVRRTDDTLLLVDGTPSDLRRYARLAQDAVPTVTAVLEDWQPRLVVEVPADSRALERALGVEPGFYEQIAAVTGSGDGSSTPQSPTHVFVNPEVFDGLGARGQQVVLSHEATHVAADGPTSRAPTWLVEGFADYVALRDTPLPLSRTAAQISEQVAEDGVPEGLPGPSEFDTRTPRLGAVYESAWLVCVTLADRGGEDALQRLYRTVSDGADLDQQLRRIFDWSQAELVSAWQERLRRLAA